MSKPLDKEKEIFSVVSSGIYTLDRALNGGMPLRSIYEIYGYTNSCKSTLGYHLAGVAARAKCTLIADFEHFDPNYLEAAIRNAGGSGPIEMADTDDGESAVGDIRDALKDTTFGSVMLDSVGALIPKVELEGKVTDANMGVKPRLMAKMMRYALYGLKRNNECIFLIINHLHPIMSLGSGAASTSGGVAIHNNSHVRLKLKAFEKEIEYRITEGKVDKCRDGGEGGTFRVASVTGLGIHLGLTAVVECQWLGLVDEGRTVKLDGKSYGYLKNLVTEAASGNDEVFQPFRNKLHVV